MHAKRLLAVIALSAALLWAVSLINRPAQAAPSYRPVAAPPWNTNVRVNDTAVAGPVARSAPAFAATDSLVYAVWQDARNGDADIYSAQSVDAGQTWGYIVRVNHDVPGLDQLDPDLAVNVSGTLHAVWEDYGIYYARSTNGGRAWGDAIKISDASGAAVDPAIAVYTNTVCVAWVDATNVRADCSTDNGATWPTPDLTAPTVNGLTPDLIVDSTGQVHMTWADQRTGHYDIYYARWSGSKSWSAATKLNTDAGTTTQQYPSIALNGSRMAVGWQDNRSGTQIYARYSANTGSTWSASDVQVSDAGNVIGAPALTVGRGALWATWLVFSGSTYIAYADTGTTAWGTDALITSTTQARQDIAAAGNTSYVWAGWAQDNAIWNAARSTSWGSPYQTSNAGEATQKYPALGAANNGDLFSVWNDNRSVGAGLYAAKSTDGGITWGTNNFVSGSVDSGQPALAVTGTSTLHVAWRQEDYNYWRMYYNRSTDGGSTWLTATALMSVMQEHRPQAGVSPAVESPDVAVLGNNVFLSWAANGSLYLAKSTNGGSTWGAPTNVFTMVNTTTVAATGKVALRAYASTLDKLVLAWTNNYNRTCAAYSDDGGATWLKRTCFNGGDATSAQNPAIGYTSGSAYIAWNDNRSGGLHHVYYGALDSSGNAYRDSQRVDDMAGPATFPAIIQSQDSISTYINVMWQDASNGHDDVYWSRSSNFGNTWQASVRVNDDTGTYPQQRPVLASNWTYSTTKVWTAWQDFRRANWDIYATTITRTCDVPLTGVGISGTPSAWINQQVVLSSILTPSNASTPIGYEWRNPPNPVQDTSSATYTWSTYGDQVVTLTASSCSALSKVQTVRVKCSVPITDITFERPNWVVAGSLFTLTAIMTPTSPDLPTNIHWTPEPEAGQGTLQAQYRLLAIDSAVDSRLVTVAAENCDGTWGGSASDQQWITVKDFASPIWSNFQPSSWVSQSVSGYTVPFSITVQDVGSGLQITGAQVAYSNNGGSVWSAWEPLACTGSNGTPDKQICSGQHDFEHDSGNYQSIYNLVKTYITDSVGLSSMNVAELRFDVTPPNNPTNLTLRSPSTHAIVLTNTWLVESLLEAGWSGASDGTYGSGVKDYLYVWSQSPTTLPDETTPGVNYVSAAYVTRTIQIPADGQGWYFHFRARDNVNLLAATALHAGPYWLDGNPPGTPDIESTIPVTLTWSNDNTPTVRWYPATDDGSGVSGYSFVWDTNLTAILDYLPDPVLTGGGVVYTTSAALFDNDNYWFHLIACDNAGGQFGVPNCSLARNVGPFQIDATAPYSQSALADPLPSSWTNDNTIALNWSHTTPLHHSPEDRYSYVWDTVTNTVPPAAANLITSAVNITLTTTLADGSNRWFHMRTGDQAGNWSSTYHLGPFRIYAAAPTAPVISGSTPPTNTVTNDNTVTVNYSSTDTGGSGVAGYSRSWTKGTQDVPDDTLDTGNTSPALTNGTWYFHVKAQDTAGNWSAVVHYGPFLIDITPAVIFLDHDSGGPGSDVYVIGLGYEPNVTVTLSFRRKPDPVVYSYTPLGEFLTSPDGAFHVLATVPVEALSKLSQFKAASPAKSAQADFTVTANMTLTLQPNRVKPGQNIAVQASGLNPGGSVYFETDLGHHLGAYQLNGATSKSATVHIESSVNTSATHVLTATLRVGGAVVMRKAVNFDVYQQAYTPPPPSWITTNITHSQHGAAVAVSGYNNWDLESDCLMTAEQWYGKDYNERTGLEILIEPEAGEPYFACGKPEYDLVIRRSGSSSTYGVSLAALSAPGIFSKPVGIPDDYYDASAPENASEPLWPVASELAYGQYEICMRGRLKATEAATLTENYACGERQICQRTKVQYNLATLHSAMLACTPFTVDPAPAFTGRVILSDGYPIPPADSPQIFVSGQAIGTTGGDHPVVVDQTFAAVSDYNIHYTLPEGAYSFTAFACNHIPTNSVRMTGRGTNNLQSVYLIPVNESGPAILGVDPQLQSYLDGYNKVGPFLSMQGVSGAEPVPAVFKLRFDNAFEVITDVKATLAGQEYHATPTGDSNYWTLTWPDLGTLPPGELKMEFRAYGHYKGDCGNQPDAWGPVFSVSIVMAEAPPWLKEPDWGSGFGPAATVDYDPATGKYHMTGQLGIGEQNGDIDLALLGSIQNRIGASVDVVEDFDTRTGVWTATAKVQGEATLLCYSGMPGAPEKCVSQYTMNLVATPAGGTVQLAGQPSYPGKFTGDTYLPSLPTFGPFEVYNGVIASYFGVVNVNLSVSFGVNPVLAITPGMDSDMGPNVRLEPGAQFTGRIDLWVDILMGVASAGVTAEPSLGLTFPITIDRYGPHLEDPGACLRLRGSVWLKALWWKKTFGPATIFETGSACDLFPRETEMCLANETPPPAAMPAPSLATDGLGHLMATWIHDTSNDPAKSEGVLYAVYFDGAAWGEPAPVDGDPNFLVSDPAIDFASEGVAVAVYSANLANAANPGTWGETEAQLAAQKVYAKVWDGTTWLTRTIVAQGGGPHGRATIAGDPANQRAMAMWIHDASSGNTKKWQVEYSVFSASTLTWTQQATAGPAPQDTFVDAEVALAFNSNGAALATWVRQGGVQARNIITSPFMYNDQRRIVIGVWEPGTNVWTINSQPSGLPTGALMPDVTFDNSGRPVIAYALYLKDRDNVTATGLGNNNHLGYAVGSSTTATNRPTDAQAITWQARVVPALRGVERPRVVVLPEEQATVIYRGFDASNSNGALSAVTIDLSVRTDLSVTLPGRLSHGSVWQIDAVAYRNIGSGHTSLVAAGHFLQDGLAVAARPGVNTQNVSLPGDDVLAVHIPVLPDLAVASDDLIVNETLPLSGTLVPVTVTVRNLGLARTHQPVTVALVAQSAVSGDETPIVTDTVPADLMFNGTFTLSGQWLSRSGLYRIVARVSPPIEDDVEGSNNEVYALVGALEQPAGLIGSLNVVDRSITLTWQPELGAALSHYRVYRTSGAGTVAWLADAAEPWYRDAAIQPGAAYRYAVSAVSDSGVESPLSEELTLGTHALYLPLIRR